MRGRGWLACCCTERRQMALQANRVHIGMSQKFWICSAVRDVTGRAAFRLDHCVLINVRSSHCGVAFCAYIKLPCGSVARTFSIIAMRIVAVRALDHPLCHLVAEGHGELRLELRVALVAEFRLRQLEQMPWRFGCMNTMTANTAYVSFAVRGVLKVYVPACVAGLTFLIHCFGRGCGGVEDRCSVAVLFMRFAGTVTALASYALAVGHSCSAVRIIFKSLGNLLVAVRADGCGVDRILLLGLWKFGFGFVCLSRHSCGAKQHHTKQRTEADLRTASIAHGRNLELPIKYMFAALDQLPSPVFQNRSTALCKSGLSVDSYNGLALPLRKQRESFHCAGGFSSLTAGSFVLGGLSACCIINGSGPMWPRWQVPQVTGAPELSIFAT